MNQTIYPIGIQNFEKIRKDGYLYIDKTALIYQLANRLGRPMNDVLVAIENVGNIENRQTRKRISVVSDNCRGSTHVGIPRDRHWYGEGFLQHGIGRKQCRYLHAVGRYL